MPTVLSKRFICFFIGFMTLICGVLLKDFLSGTILVNIDSLASYGVFKYFYNNLINGVVPLWEPFIYLGRPHIHLALNGVLNILVFPILLLHYVGVNYYGLFLIYLSLYFILGICGFFLLARLILKSDSYALVAVTFLTFSGLPAMLFNQIYIVMLFVPAVWFFVFFMKFFHTFAVRHFWGMVCSLMVLAISYYPFYFVCLVLSFLICYVIFYRGKFFEKLSGCLCFIKSHRAISAFGVVCLLVAFIPLSLFKIANSTGEILSPARHSCNVGEKCSKNVEMNYEEVALAGTFGERFSGGRIFSHLDKFNYWQDSFIYVPSFAFIILFMAMFTVMDRIRMVIFGVICAIFIISLGAATPIYKWLFNHVFFFKYFRNLFFFTAFLIPLCILFAVAQLKSFLEQLFVAKLKFVVVLLIILGHILFLCLLNYQGNIILATYVALLASLIFFVISTIGAFHQRRWVLLPLLAMLIVIEPTQVFTCYRQNTSKSVHQLPAEHKISKFEYIRPQENYFGDSFYVMFIHNADFRDASGVGSFRADFLNSYVFDFYNQTPLDKQSQDTQNKILIYDRSSQEARPKGAFDLLESDSSRLKVVHFDVNSLTLKAHFLSQKFLVYRDAYSVYWKAFINGKESKIQLVDGTFKGIDVPAGENLIVFRYQPPGGQWAYVFVLLTMFFAFFLLGVLYFRSQGGELKTC